MNAEYEIAQKLINKEIRPEFGNAQHIAALKLLQEEAEENKKHKFKVILTYSATITTEQEVDAVDEEEALEIAKDEPFTVEDIEDADLVNSEVTRIKS